MTGNLQGLNVLITGASSGIGLAAAEAMAAGGARVGMVARRHDVLLAAAERVGGHPIQGDVTLPEDVERISKELSGTLGGAPDVLINAAGFFSIDALSETSVEDLDRNLSANIRGPFLMIRALLPAMRERGSGHIVNVGSVAGRLAFPGNAAYSASKFGLRGLHDVLAAELSGSGIRLTLVEPAATDTGLWDELDPDSRDDLPSRTSMLQAADVARSIVFAVSQPEGVEISHLALHSIR